MGEAESAKEEKGDKLGKETLSTIRLNGEIVQTFLLWDHRV